MLRSERVKKRAKKKRNGDAQITPLFTGMIAAERIVKVLKCQCVSMYQDVYIYIYIYIYICVCK